MIPLEVGGLGDLVVILVLIMIGPPILLTIIGLVINKNQPKAAKVLYILASVYLLIGLGICGSLM